MWFVWKTNHSGKKRKKKEIKKLFPVLFSTRRFSPIWLLPLFCTCTELVSCFCPSSDRRFKIIKLCCCSGPHFGVACVPVLTISLTVPLWSGLNSDFGGKKIIKENKKRNYPMLWTCSVCLTRLTQLHRQRGMVAAGWGVVLTSLPGTDVNGLVVILTSLPGTDVNGLVVALMS